MYSHDKKLIIRNIQKDGHKRNIRFFDTNKEIRCIEKTEEEYLELPDPLSLMVQRAEDTNLKN